MSIKLVFAVMSCTGMFDENDQYHFGKDGGLPWGKFKEELEHFKKETEDTILLMGANTFKSLPRRLPGRIHVVISNNPELIRTKKGETADAILNGGTLSSCIDSTKHIFGEEKDISIIGGASIISECLRYHLADEVVVSFIVPHNKHINDFTSDVKLDGSLLDHENDYYEIHDDISINTDREDLCGAFVERWTKNIEQEGNE